MGRVAQKRWVCPACEDGVLAPSRPRKDDVRRYCWPCSKKTGYLVQRVCPAIDREREVAAARRRTKEQRAAERERREYERRYVFDGVDLPKELDRLWRLKVVKGYRPLRADLIVRHHEGYGRYGSADHGRGVITLNVRPGWDWATALCVLAHEVAHFCVRHEPGHHGPKWKEAFALICEAAYDLDHVRLPHVAHCGGHRHVEALLRETYADGPSAVRRVK